MESVALSVWHSVRRLAPPGWGRPVQQAPPTAHRRPFTSTTTPEWRATPCMALLALATQRVVAGRLLLLPVALPPPVPAHPAPHPDQPSTLSPLLETSLP